VGIATLQGSIRLSWMGWETGPSPSQRMSLVPPQRTSWIWFWKQRKYIRKNICLEVWLRQEIQVLARGQCYILA
jgi:hypothetical protein